MFTILLQGFVLFFNQILEHDLTHDLNFRMFQCRSSLYPDINITNVLLTCCILHFCHQWALKSTIMCVAFCHLIEHLHYKCQERLRVALRQPSRRRRWCILKSEKRLGVNQGIQEILALLSEETTREIYAHKLAQNYKEVLSPLSGSQGAICLHSIGYILSTQGTSCSAMFG